MPLIQATSTGHALSNASWLDSHFQSARPEYEEGLRFVGIKPGWKVLDAGCGGGGFLPLMSELTGPTGSIVAMDLAPESVERVAGFMRDGRLPSNITTKVGSMLDLPFEDATFDCVWSANVVQYLTQAQFTQAVAEFKRVLKPGGTLAIKEFDSTTMSFMPMPWPFFTRRQVGRYLGYEKTGTLGTWSGPTLPARLRAEGLSDIRRKGWMVERWAPVSTATRALLNEYLGYIAKMIEADGLEPHDVEAWRAIAADPSKLIDDPDFCFREGFVVAVGTKAQDFSAR